MGNMVALKEFDCRNETLKRRIHREFKIAKQNLKHPNIAQIFEHFIINQTVYASTELCELGDLNKHFIHHQVELGNRISFMLDMARGVNFLHAQSIVHRDLKPENILLTDQVGKIVCKISDFVASRIKVTIYDKFKTLIGSPAYIAPEVTGDKEYANEVDVYSLGLLFFFVYRNSVLTNKFGTKGLIPGIYDEKNRILFLSEILRREKPTKDSFLASYFADGKNIGELVYDMLNLKPEERPYMGDVLELIVETKIQIKHKKSTSSKISTSHELQDRKSQKSQRDGSKFVTQGEIINDAIEQYAAEMELTKDSAKKEITVDEYNTVHLRNKKILQISEETEIKVSCKLIFL